MDIDPRDRFSTAADQVGPVPLDAIVSKGTRLRRQRRLGLVGGAVALLLVAAGVVGYQALKPGPKVALHVVGTPPAAATEPPSATPTPSTLPSPKPSPLASPTPGAAPVTGITELAIEDSTWVSDRTGWVLGTAHCEGTPCTVILHTTDGGHSWSQVAAPAGVTHLRFANPSVGYAYNDPETINPLFFMTTDGAATWQKQSAPYVEGLEISGGTAVRIATTGTGCPGPCNAKLQASAVGTTSWRQLPIPSTSMGAGDGFGEGIALQGSNIYFMAFRNVAGGTIAQSRLVLSHDNGLTWTAKADPCGPPPTASVSEVDAVSFAAAPNGFLAILCFPRFQNPSTPFVLTSTNAGATFGPAKPVAGVTFGPIAAGSRTNLLVLGDNGVSVSNDGGTTWRTTLGGQPKEQTLVGFEDARTARVFGAGTLYTSTDAGDTWTASNPAG